MMEGTLEGSTMEEVVAFWRAFEDASKDVDKLGIQLSGVRQRVEKLFYAAAHANLSSEVLAEVTSLRKDLGALDTELNGNSAKNQIGERNKPTLGDRTFALWRGISTSTYGPTDTHKETMEIIKKQATDIMQRLGNLQAKATDLSNRVEAAGGSWVEGN